MPLKSTELVCSAACQNDVSQPSTWMQYCLQLALKSVGISNPNPSVGCVLVSEDGKVLLGEGHTQAAGGPHAEVMALRDAAAKRVNVHGATAYVTLEPCSHYGRTPPCSDALVEAGIARVIAALQDPNALVAGQGFAKLRAKGVQVEVGDGADQAREINIGFLRRMQRNMPWIRIKAATSLDGVTALANGKSQWITSEAARLDVHFWRARACAVLTGVGTILVDNPLLNVRTIATHRQPYLLILDSQLRTPTQARLFSVADRKVIIFALESQQPDADIELRRRALALQKSGAEIVWLPPATSNPDISPNRLDLNGVLQRIAKLPVNEVHVEAGATLNGALMQASLVDEWLIYQAPCLLGSGLPLVQLEQSFSSLEQAKRLYLHDVQTVGKDIRLRLFTRPLVEV